MVSKVSENAERKYSDEHQRDFGRIGEQRGQTGLCKDGAEGGRKRGAGIGEADRGFSGSNTHGDTNERCHNNTNEDSALNFANQQYNGEH